MPPRTKNSKQKIDSTGSGALDAYISSKKASDSIGPSENEFDTPNTTNTGPESNATIPTPPQPLKRKRAANEAKTARRLDRGDSSGGKQRQSKGYVPPSTYSHLPPLPDTLIANLLCVFVGLNPGIQTATKGHPYAHPSNLYWPLLHTSGLTPDRRLAPSEYVTLPEKYSLGNTNIVSRATKDGSGLSKEEMVAGAGVLDEKIRKWKPETVCLVGKSIWEAVWKWKHGRGMKKEEFKYGFQDVGENMGRKQKKRNGGFFGEKKAGKQTGEDDVDDDDSWGGARVFVATSTSGLAASLSLTEKQEIWAELGGSVQRRRKERKEAMGKEEAIKSERGNDVAESVG